MSENYNMWEYWRDKKGYELALVQQFPNTLEGNIALQIALTQLKSAEVAIDNIIQNMKEVEEDEQGLLGRRT